ncbi:hypothetical protein ACSQ67_010168 [Phaseolus vulgaris]
MIYRLNCPKRLSKMEKANTSYHVVELPTTFKPHPTTSRTIKRELPDKSIKLWPMEQSIKTFEIGKDKVLLGPIKAEVVSRVMPKTFMKCHIFHVPPSIKVVPSAPTKPKEVSKPGSMDWSDVYNKRKGFTRLLNPSVDYVVPQVSFVKPCQTYSSDDLTTFFLQEPGFEFWQKVWYLPQGLSGHFNLFKTSFEEAKATLEKDIQEVKTDEEDNNHEEPLASWNFQKILLVNKSLNMTLSGRQEYKG